MHRLAPEGLMVLIPIPGKLQKYRNSMGYIKTQLKVPVNVFPQDTRLG